MVYTSNVVVKMLYHTLRVLALVNVINLFLKLFACIYNKLYNAPKTQMSQVPTNELLEQQNGLTYIASQICP